MIAFSLSLSLSCSQLAGQQPRLFQVVKAGVAGGGGEAGDAGEVGEVGEDCSRS